MSSVATFPDYKDNSQQSVSNNWYQIAVYHVNKYIPAVISLIWTKYNKWREIKLIQAIRFFYLSTMLLHYPYQGFWNDAISDQ